MWFYRYRKRSEAFWRATYFYWSTTTRGKLDQIGFGRSACGEFTGDYDYPYHPDGGVPRRGSGGARVYRMNDTPLR